MRAKINFVKIQKLRTKPFCIQYFMDFIFNIHSCCCCCRTTSLYGFRANILLLLMMWMGYLYMCEWIPSCTLFAEGFNFENWTHVGIHYFHFGRENYFHLNNFTLLFHLNEHKFHDLISHSSSLSLFPRYCSYICVECYIAMTLSVGMYV